MRLPNRIPAVWLVISGIVSVQVGAAIARSVRPGAADGDGLAAAHDVRRDLALGGTATVDGAFRSGLADRAGFGVSLMTMNWAIYQSFARIPLGIAVTIEFLGPLTVAVIGSRRFTDLIWVALAGWGRPARCVEGQPDARRSWLRSAGGLAWAFYILLSAQTGRRWPGSAALPLPAWSGHCAWHLRQSWRPAADAEPNGASGVAVGLLSSVIPYSFELIALRRIPPRSSAS